MTKKIDVVKSYIGYGEYIYDVFANSYSSWKQPEYLVAGELFDSIEYLEEKGVPMAYWILSQEF